MRSIRRPCCFASGPRLSLVVSRPCQSSMSSSCGAVRRPRCCQAPAHLRQQLATHWARLRAARGFVFERSMPLATLRMSRCSRPQSCPCLSPYCTHIYQPVLSSLQRLICLLKRLRRVVVAKSSAFMCSTPRQLQGGRHSEACLSSNTANMPVERTRHRRICFDHALVLARLSPQR